MAKKNKGVLSLSGDPFEKYMVGDSVMYKAYEGGVWDASFVLPVEKEEWSEYVVKGINVKERLLRIRLKSDGSALQVWVRFENTQLLPF